VKLVALVLCLCVAAAVSAADKKQAKPPTVTLSVKNADVVDVLQSLKKQCGVKNLVIDPGVGGQVGSLYLKDVPCRTAFTLVLRMSGLDAKIYDNSLVHVGAPRR
jgi:type II secretory pathway component GspD/PulD (secretin)